MTCLFRSTRKSSYAPPEVILDRIGKVQEEIAYNVRALREMLGK